MPGAEAWGPGISFLTLPGDSEGADRPHAARVQMSLALVFVQIAGVAAAALPHSLQVENQERVSTFGVSL